MGQETGAAEPVLAANAVYHCLEGYFARFGAEGVDMKVVAERKKAAALACKEAAEQNADVKGFLAL